MSEGSASVARMTASAAPGIRVLVLPGDEKAYLRYLVRQPGTTSNLEALSAIVGGWIESVGLTDEAVMYINEEGKDSGFAANPAANRLFGKGEHVFAVAGDFLVGPAVVVGLVNARGQHDGDDHDVPQSVLDLCATAGIEIVDETQPST